MSDEVIVEFDGPVVVITINRPHVRNAVNRQVAEQLAAAVDELSGRSDLAIGIINGAGRSFSAGMDLKAFAGGELPSLPGRGFAGLVERPPVKPLIAAVEGYALAGGCEIALACDLVVAANDAMFGLPEVKRGLVAAGGGLLRLPRRLPYQLAMEIALTGDFLAAPRAHQCGLVNRLAEPGGALEEARRLAAAIAANGPLAVRATKQIIVESADWPAEDAFERQRQISDPVFASADAAEGARAFAEKRPPAWTGH